MSSTMPEATNAKGGCVETGCTGISILYIGFFVIAGGHHVTFPDFSRKPALGGVDKAFHLRLGQVLWSPQVAVWWSRGGNCSI
jgi:hypothetical protein